MNTIIPFVLAATVSQTPTKSPLDVVACMPYVTQELTTQEEVEKRIAQSIAHLKDHKSNYRGLVPIDFFYDTRLDLYADFSAPLDTLDLRLYPNNPYVPSSWNQEQIVVYNKPTTTEELSRSSYVIPGPGAFALAGLAAFAVSRRRRN